MERISSNVTFAADSVSLFTIGQNKVTFPLCLDFHWKDRLKNSNHVIYKYALQKQRFYCHVKYVMVNYLKKMLPSGLCLQLYLKIFVLGKSCRY